MLVILGFSRLVGIVLPVKRRCPRVISIKVLIQGIALPLELTIQAFSEGAWSDNGQQDEVDDLAFEYVRRDLLNRILGNADNHGRNTSIIRVDGGFRLAPIYDLAPMILDDEGITRTTKWASERKGSSQWKDNCAELTDYTDPDVLLQRLMSAAEAFRALPDLLVDAPESTRSAATLPVNNLDKRLAEWGLR